MEKKYTEIISKHGPLFMNLKYMERLNLEDSSLAKEKWTTELFETFVEVMPIIIEEDKKDKEECQLMDENSTNILTQANIETFPSLEGVGMGFLNPRKASGSEAWWTSMDGNTQGNPLEDYQPLRKHFHLASYPHQDVKMFANPLLESDSLDPVSSEDKQEKQKMKFPISDSNERNIHEIKYGRIARPLSSKYCLQVTKDISLKPTTSVMHLPLHEDQNNLSSLYDELYAEIIEKKFNPFSTKRKSKGLVLELFRNPNYEQIPRTSKNQTPPTNTKFGTDINSPNLEKKDENISRKRTHQNI
ncbi:hypothetical protein WA026_004575 [Henosepilachna vigintioctopunctata]|uniref:Uncharacterized protein n=1 Tax=Henosepilachna vigintioctopunctata TaxID=420089 RepID=A0AAW1VB73_9CUCU